MRTTPDLSAVISANAAQRALRPRPDLHEPGWSFWELRNLNMHRVVGLVKEHRQVTDARGLESEIRGIVLRYFKAAWWRGMAYGIVADVASLSVTLDDLKVLVDIYDNRSGTLQWVILLSEDARTALGAHTWLESYLSPVYRGILRVLSDSGYRVASARREKDGLMNFLTGVADAEAVVGSFGTRRGLFPQFQNPTTKGAR